MEYSVLKEMSPSSHFLQGLGNHAEEEAERLEEQKEIEDTQETRSSRQSRTEVHRNS